MLFYKTEDGKVGMFGREKASVNLKGNIFTASETFLARSADYLIIEKQSKKSTNIIFDGRKYMLVDKQENDKIATLLEGKKDEGLNYDLLKVIVSLKEMKLVYSLINLDFDDLQSMINYDEEYNSSRNKKFIPGLNIYNLEIEKNTLFVGQQILSLRTKLYESASDAEKNHIIFGIKNPVIWLSYDIKTKRVMCGALQYRKGLHTREFDMMVYNLNLLNKFKLTNDKIKFATLMRDNGLL